VWQAVHDALRDLVRVYEGRDPQPTAASIDSQSVHGADTVPRATRGYDAGKRVNTSYLEHYNGARPHRGIGLDVPVPAPVPTVTALPTGGRVERVDVLGGLIHEYRLAA